MERDEMGRFVKGNKGGPGRKKRSTEENYLRTLEKCATAKEWKAICEKAIEQAKEGDARARQWLSDYLLGKPVQEVKLETVADVIINLDWGDDYEDDQTSEASQGPMESSQEQGQVQGSSSGTEMGQD